MKKFRMRAAEALTIAARALVALLLSYGFYVIVQFFSPYWAGELRELALFTGFLVIVMVVYKLVNRIKVVW